MADVIGFEFRIEEGDDARWVRIMGAGGLLGNGMLAAANSSGLKSSAVLALLKRAQRRLITDGHIRVLRSWELPPDERFERVVPRRISAVRPIWDPRRAPPQRLEIPDFYSEKT